jgi:ATP-binding cassette subfamily B protein
MMVQRDFKLSGTESRSVKSANARRLLRLARPYWPHLTGIFLLSLISTPISLLLALPLKIAVDNVIGSRPLAHSLQWLLPASAMGSKAAYLLLTSGILLGLSIVMNLQSLAAWLLQTYTGEKLVLDFRSHLFWHVQRLNLLFHDRRGTNDVAYRIQHDAPAIQYIFIQGFLPLVSATISFLAMVYVTARIDWQLAAVALLLSPVLFGLARKSSRRARVGWEGVKRLDSNAMLALHEALASIRVVKAYGQEHFEDNRFRLRSRQRMMEQLSVASTQAVFHVLISTALAFGTAAALFIGVRHVSSGALTLGSLLLVMAYMTQLYEPLKTVSGKLPEIQSWMASMNRTLMLLEEAPELVEAHSAAHPARVAGHISFRNVSFAYSSTGTRVLDGVSFDIAAGTKVGVIGPSGSGKSTLINLLTRFYDPVCGQILLDGCDLRGYSLTALRAQFSILLQDPVVFSATVAENIAYGRPEASREEIIASARAAGAHEFILALPKGYDTEIGEGGRRLSGGQRQRLAIARAFLKDAPVLILDEPTSAIDIHTEKEIMEATNKLVRGRTTFMIAHRLSTVRNCDLLLVLREGRLQALTSEFEVAMSALTDVVPSGSPDIHTVVDSQSVQ